MPITLLDVLLLVVMLISGLLAMIRGFMREILSIAAWGLAALATLYAYPRVTPIVQQYVANDAVAKGIAVVGVFLVTLLAVSIITVRISDMILDSRVGALDRTLGFLFGLGRGLIILVAAYLFFDFFVPDSKKPEWVNGAKSKVVLSGTGAWLKAQLPEDLDKTISKFRRPKPGEEQEPPPDTGPERTEIAPRGAAPARPATTPKPAAGAPRPMPEVIQSKPAGNQ